MKSKIKKVLGFFVFCAAIIPFTNVDAATTVTDETGLTTALNGNETEIVLGSNITTTAPIQVSKDVTIDGKGFTINAGYTGTDGNKTILASTTTGTLTLKNITIANSPKYGVQAHNGGHVVLDGVTIMNSGYGAALANGGTITVKSLTMSGNSYGIEFGVGNNVTGTPALIMDGTIDASKQTGDVVYADVNQVKEIIVQNTSSSAQKVNLDGNKVVITDASGKTVAVSNELPVNTVVNVNGTENTVTDVEEPVVPNEPAKEESKNETKEEIKNPETSDNIIIYALLALAGIGGVTYTSKKLLKHN